MNISEAIAILEKLKDEKGDLNLKVYDNEWGGYETPEFEYFVDPDENEWIGIHTETVQLVDDKGLS